MGVGLLCCWGSSGLGLFDAVCSCWGFCLAAVLAAGGWSADELAEMQGIADVLGRNVTQIHYANLFYEFNTLGLGPSSESEAVYVCRSCKGAVGQGTAASVSRSVLSGCLCLCVSVRVSLSLSVFARVMVWDRCSGAVTAGNRQREKAFPLGWKFCTSIVAQTVRAGSRQPPGRFGGLAQAPGLARAVRWPDPPRTQPGLLHPWPPQHHRRRAISAQQSTHLHRHHLCQCVGRCSSRAVAGLGGGAGDPPLPFLFSS